MHFQVNSLITRSEATETELGGLIDGVNALIVQLHRPLLCVEQVLWQMLMRMMLFLRVVVILLPVVILLVSLITVQILAVLMMVAVLKWNKFYKINAPKTRSIHV